MKNTKVLDEQGVGQVDELVYGLDLRARRLQLDVTGERYYESQQKRSN
jgi:hypothetical protein